MHPRGIEPLFLSPEPSVLSIRLRVLKLIFNLTRKIADTSDDA